MTLKYKLISLALGVLVTLTPEALSQSARTVMVQSNSGVVLFPTNLWSANAGAARTGLSLATHATNPVVPVFSGGTGATNAAGARTALGVPFSFGTGTNSTIGGGLSNQASGVYSAVVGGLSNTASGAGVVVDGSLVIEGRAFVGGGSLNNALGAASVVAGGGGNTVTEWASAIGGGNNNIISNRFSVIAGGLGNRIVGEGREAAIAGGYYNVVSNAHGFVGAGLFNVAGGGQSVVVGGSRNDASAESSFVGGGFSNQATGIYSVVGGGLSNTASGVEVVIDGQSYAIGRATVSGGARNAATGALATIGGGDQNAASGWGTTVAGGLLNTNSNSFGTIAGGIRNNNSGYGGVIMGGENNVAEGLYAVVAGGVFNESAQNSFSSGSRAKATNSGSFVFSDISSTNNFGSTNNNSFNVRAHGGLSLDLGTNGIAFRSTTNAAVTRTNLGLGLPALTNTNNLNMLTAIGGLATNGNGGGLTNIQASSLVGLISPSNISSINFSNVGGTLLVSSGGTGATNAFGARSNLGLSLAALTNVNNANFLAAFFGANTNPVLVDTNGAVVSPANFWQVAPVLSVFQEVAPLSSTNVVATNARVLRFQSLAPTINNVTNTVELPTNNVLAGDSATILHRGPTNSVTAVRQQGAATNLVSMSRPEEAIGFIYHNGAWRLDNNLSYIEPIYFSGADAASNAAVSRDSLGLGFTALTNTNVTNFRTAIGLGATNPVSFNTITVTNNSSAITMGSASSGISASNLVFTFSHTGSPRFSIGQSNITLLVQGGALTFDPANTTGAGITRSNLSLGVADTVTFGSVVTGSVVTGGAGASFGPSSNGGVALGWQGVSDRVTIDGGGFRLNAVGLAFSFGTNNTNGAAITRTNLGLGGGVTTNISVVGTNNTNTLVFSNGILKEVQ